MSKKHTANTRGTIISVISGIIIGAACGIGILIAVLGLKIVWSLAIVAASLILVCLIVWADTVIHKDK